MNDIVKLALQVIELRGDTYSSYEIINLLQLLVNEIGRLREQLDARGMVIRERDFEIKRLRDEIYERG